MSAASVEDYLWEVEYECPHRLACRERTPDSHVTVRPLETYFRYTTPNAEAFDDITSEIGEIDALVHALQASVANVPEGLNKTKVGVP